MMALFVLRFWTAVAYAVAALIVSCAAVIAGPAVGIVIWAAASAALAFVVWGWVTKPIFNFFRYWGRTHG